MKRTLERSLLAACITSALAVLVACGGGGGSNSQCAGLAGNAQVTKAETGADASRFLTQATFGPTLPGIERVLNVQLEAWLEGEGDLPTAWPGIEALSAARSRKGRHGAILLPLRTLLAAIEEAK